MAEELNIGMPDMLDIGSTYTLRVTALSASGALVAGVKIDTTTITADQVVPVVPGETSQQTTQLYGDWYLVPGPGA